jgi:sugar phosphate permease
MRREYGLLLALWIGYLVNYLNRFSLPASLPEVSRDLSLSPLEAGLIVSLFFLAYTGMQFPAGLLSDRYNPLRIVGVGCLLYSLLGGAFVLSQNALHAILSRTLFGLFQAFGWVPTIAALFLLVGREERGKAMGLFTSTLAVGPFLSGLAAAFVLGRYPWPYAFLFPSLVGILFSLSFLLLTRRVSFPERRRPQGSPLRIWKSRPLWLLALGYLAVIYVYWGGLTWIPSFLFHLGYSAEKAAFLGLAWTLPGLLSQPLGGLLSDRYPEKKALLLSASLLSLAVVFLLLAAAPPWGVVPLLFLLGFFVLLPFAPIFTLPAEILSAQEAGGSAGFLNAVSHLGAIAAPTLFGALLQATGEYAIALLSFLPVCLLGGIAALGIPRGERSIPINRRPADGRL